MLGSVPLMRRRSSMPSICGILMSMKIEVGMEGAERLQRGLAAVRGGDLVARLEDHAQGLARSQLVVDHEHRADGRSWLPRCRERGGEADLAAALFGLEPPALALEDALAHARSHVDEILLDDLDRIEDRLQLLGAGPPRCGRPP